MRKISITKITGMFMNISNVIYSVLIIAVKVNTNDESLIILDAMFNQ